MEKSSEVREALLRFYEAVRSNAVDRFDEVVEMGDATLVIGTGPGEYVRERDRLESSMRIEGYELDPGPDPTGYAEGMLGWVTDEPVFRLPDGTQVASRLTAVLHKGEPGWRVVHAHFSVGVPDEEVADLQQRWGTSPQS